jgi:hypothetical protein
MKKLIPPLRAATLPPMKISSSCRFVLLALLAMAAASADAETRMQVAAASTPVYTRPSADAPQAGKASSGEILFVSNVDGDWAAISPPDRLDVWLNKDFIEGNRVIAKSIQIRSGPGVQYDIVGTLERGAPVMPRGEDGDWCKIAPPSSVTLWVKKSDLSEVVARTTPIREVATVATPAPQPPPEKPVPQPEVAPASRPQPLPQPTPSGPEPAAPIQSAPQPSSAPAATVKVAPSNPNAPAPQPIQRPAPAPATMAASPSAPAPSPMAPSAAPARPVAIASRTPSAPVAAPTPAVSAAPSRPAPAPSQVAPPAPRPAAPALRPATAIPGPAARSASTNAAAPQSPRPAQRPAAVPAAAKPAPASSGAATAQKPKALEVQVDQKLVDGLDLDEELPNQGKSVQVEGELRNAPFLAASPSRYRLLAYDDGVLEMVCHVHGDPEMLREYIGKGVSIRGREYWVEESDMPVVVVGQIEPLAPADEDEPVLF